MNRIKKYTGWIALTLMAMMAASCGQESEREEMAEEIPSQVSLSKEQMELAGFEFGRLEKQLLSGDVNARGMLSLPPGEEAVVEPVIGGVVSKILVTPGQSVKTGQLLATLTHPDFIAMQQEYIHSSNRLEFLKNDFDRQQRLYQEKVSSEKQFLQVKTDYETTKAAVKSHEIILSQLGLNPEEILAGQIKQSIPVSSPMEGMVDEVITKLGKHVSDGDQLFRIVCRKRLMVELSVFEKDIMKVKPAQRVTFILSNVDSGEEYEAEITAIGGSVQQMGRVVKVLAEFTNTGQMLLPGMFVAAVIHTGEQSFEALPESAIMNYGSPDTYVYYTLSAPDAPLYTFEKLPVETGFAEDGFIRVKLLGEMPPNARIVTRGGYYVKAEEAKTEE